MDFTYDSYVALLTFIKDLGYAICPFRAVPGAGPYVILRHDVDYSVAKAREMAEIECRLGVTSTVFLLLSSPYYNLLQQENLEAAKAIAGMGHEIGLHYDCEAFAGLGAEAQGRRVAMLARQLEEHVGVAVTSVAQHNPSESSLRPVVPGFLDAYSDRFFKEIGYLSDSRRLFGVPDLRQFFKDHRRSQLLVHPLWWHHQTKSRGEAFAAVGAALADQVGTRLSRMNASMERDEQRLGRR